jgi:hypothetical protein
MSRVVIVKARSTTASRKDGPGSPANTNGVEIQATEEPATYQEKKWAEVPRAKRFANGNRSALTTWPERANAELACR